MIRIFFIIITFTLLVFFEIFFSKSLIDAFLVIFGLTFIVYFLLRNKQVDLFSPIYLFSLYYMIIYFYIIILQVTGIANNVFIQHSIINGDLDFNFSLAITVVFVSYFSTFFGYRTVVNKCSNFKPLPIIGMNNQFYSAVAIVFFLLGFINFIINIYLLAGGDLINFYKSVSMRRHQFSEGGTTLYYNLLYFSAYMFFIRDTQNKKIRFTTYTAVFISVLVSISQGRISQTLFYFASFMIIYYYNFGSSLLNRKYVFFGIFIIFAGVSFYILRILGNMSFNGFSSDFDDILASFFDLDRLYHLFFERGNFQNFPLLVKVIDSASIDLGYQYGKTLLFPFYGFLSIDFWGLIHTPEMMAKAAWYSDADPKYIPTGNLPITGMGEMYLNFSWFGVVFGMFLFGVLGGVIKRIMIRSGSNIFLIFYVKFILFFMIYSKGSFNNFDLFWMMLPSLTIWLVVSFGKSFSYNRKGTVN